MWLGKRESSGWSRLQVFFYLGDGPAPRRGVTLLLPELRLVVNVLSILALYDRGFWSGVVRRLYKVMLTREVVCRGHWTFGGARS